jgi:Tfp pilus assembly protein PilX
LRYIQPVSQKNNFKERKDKIMKVTIKQAIHKEEGIILIGVLGLLSIIALMATLSVTSTFTEIKISSNHKTGVQSFYVAEAGVQRAKAELKTVAFGDVLNGDYGGSPGVLSFGTDTTFANGTYSVTVQDNDDGDGDTSVDSDNIVNIIATGALPDGSRSSVELKILKTPAIPPIPAAITVAGEADTWISNSSLNYIEVDGRDWRLSDTDITGPTGPEADKYAIALSNIGDGASSQTPADAIASLDNDIPAFQEPKFVGKPAAYTESIGLETGMTSQDLQAFVDAAKDSADNTLTGSDVPVSGNIPGGTSGPNNQITIGSQTIEMGTVSDPKITYFNMKPEDNGGADQQVDFQSNIVGCGLLIIEGNDLIFRDYLDWKGMIIVIGDNVGAGIMGEGNQAEQYITGAVIVDEQGTDPTAFKELVLQWKTNIRYSSEAVALATDLVTNIGAGDITVLTWRQL